MQLPPLGKPQHNNFLPAKTTPAASDDRLGVQACQASSSLAQGSAVRNSLVGLVENASHQVASRITQKMRPSFIMNSHPPPLGFQRGAAWRIGSFGLSVNLQPYIHPTPCMKSPGGGA
jgi:hypothetical protein